MARLNRIFVQTHFREASFNGKSFTLQIISKEQSLSIDNPMQLRRYGRCFSFNSIACHRIFQMRLHKLTGAIKTPYDWLNFFSALAGIRGDPLPHSYSSRRNKKGVPDERRRRQMCLLLLRTGNSVEVIWTRSTGICISVPSYTAL